MKIPFIWAHRGASAVAPENTLAAFRAAEAAGADGIELDVHLNRDGVPVVIHDETVDRTTDGRGAVRRMRGRELRRLDAGRWFAAEFAGERLPELSEVLAWAGDRMRLNVEIKSATAGATVVRLLRDFPQARVLASSFDHRLLRALRRLDPDLPLGFLVEHFSWRGILRAAADCRAESLHPSLALLSRPMVAACRERGLAVYPWTIDAAQELKRVCRLGVDGVFTNHPESLRRIMQLAERKEK